MKKVGIGGLCLLLLVGTLGIGCQSAAPPTQPPPGDGNICGWPDYCHPMTARDMLQEIKDLAAEDHAKDAIDPADYEAIEEHVGRILDPMLKNAEGRHVCHLQNPTPCDELKGIHDKVQPENMPLKAEPRRGHWHTIAQELESFPTGK